MAKAIGQVVSGFGHAHAAVRLAATVGDHECLRNSQLGALHAVASHFTLRDEAGLVVLPTGAGKTAVLMLLPYVLRASRALVITPSQFVRNQIAKDFSSLKTLKRIKALPLDVPAPKVFENKKVLREKSDWESFRAYDAIVTTPSSASPALSAVVDPPPDLFDIVLVDEAHHSAARTWNALIRAFPRARIVLFTATPFRRDRREIRARHLYTYPIQRAFDDEIYGEMLYRPVTPAPGEAPDVALAKEAELALSEDREAGFDHILMVRADSRRRASELKAVYGSATALSLEVVHSGQSVRSVKKAVKKLEAGDLDGVICVNMLGEGFDLPRLKIAALHAPHRSLAVTLQFFGRFARVSEDLGAATFLAVPSETTGELEELFTESDAWGRKIRLLGQEAVGSAVASQEMLQDFEEQETEDVALRLDDVSLHSFTILNHVKALQVYGDVDLYREPIIPGFSTVKTWVNQAEGTLVFLLREEVRPEWATTPGLERVEYQLVVAYWDVKAKVLFVCSSYREPLLYKSLAKSVVLGTARGLSLNKTNRVLRPFKDLQLFHVGIRNRATGVVAESYRQIAGSAAHNALDKGDAALYHRGHLFGKGETPDGTSTIGVSSLGKIWRLDHSRIPDLVKWCKGLAREIENGAPFTTGIAIDHFGSGTDIEEIPDEIILAADWDEQLYTKPWTIQAAGGGAKFSVLDADLSVEPERIDANTIGLSLEADSVSSRLLFRIDPVPTMHYADDEQPRLNVLRGFREPDLLDVLTEEHLRFHLGDGSVLEGVELFAPMGDEEVPFDVGDLAEAVLWADEGVNPTKEIEDGGDPSGPPKEGKQRSVHNWMLARLQGSDADVVVYDHRSGECADFIALRTAEDGMATIELYHCKGSGGQTAGDRVGDAYEICGQAVKSAKFRNRRVLLKHLRRRIKSGSPIVKGDLGMLSELLGGDPRYEVPLSVYLVQPGFPKNALSPKIGSLLMAVNRGLVSHGCNQVRLICSP